MQTYSEIPGNIWLLSFGFWAPFLIQGPGAKSPLHPPLMDPGCQLPIHWLL